MSNDMQREEGQTSQSGSDKQSQTAVPYNPPPPPDESLQKRYRSPLFNGMLAAVVILLGGLMMYNYTGHQLTQLAGVSSVKTVIPTLTPTPSLAPSPSISTIPSRLN